MHSKLLLSASVAALLAATAANAAVTGSLDVNMSYGAETEGMHSTFWQVNGSGRLEFGVTDGWNGQLEVFGTESTNGTNTWYGKYGDNQGLSTGGTAFHLNTTMDDMTFGPFVMLESTTVGDNGFTDEGSGQNLFAAVGGELRWHWTPDLDLNGHVGGLFHLSSPGSDSVSCDALCNAFFAGAGATWFFDNNDAIAGNFAYVSGQGGATYYRPSFGETGWDYGASFTHQFDDCPFAAYVAYDGNSFADHLDGINYVQRDNVFSVGLKWFFNGDTLRSQHDNAGFSAPHFERMINQSLSTDDVDY